MNGTAGSEMSSRLGRSVLPQISRMGWCLMKSGHFTSPREPHFETSMERRQKACKSVETVYGVWCIASRVVWMQTQAIQLIAARTAASSMTSSCPAGRLVYDRCSIHASGALHTRELISADGVLRQTYRVCGSGTYRRHAETRSRAGSQVV